MNKPDFINKLKQFAHYDTRKSVVYILTSIVPYTLLLVAMIFLQVNNVPYWSILLLSIIAAGFYLRTFMMLHDCAHGSFSNKKNNIIIGHVSGILTFTPFFDWQKSHGLHHANVSNLDKRGFGDVWTLTLDEYYNASRSKKILYNLFRNPFFLFLIAPVFLFLFVYRFPQKKTNKKGLYSIIITNIVLAAIVIIAYFTIGITNYLLVQLPVVFLGTSSGMWLFYVQHQYKNVYWRNDRDWTLLDAALKGSSFYKLPGLLRWFTGSIGFHNIHHLNSRIPCYNLRKCYEMIPELHYIQPITFFTGFKSLNLRLWDKKSKKLLSFKEARNVLVS